MLTVNQRLKYIRKQNGDTQQALADYLQVTKPAVCKWEKTDMEIPKWAVQKICERYHISEDYLMGIGK